MQIELEDIIGSRLSDGSANRRIELPLRAATTEERARLLRDIAESLASELHGRVGRHRLQVWADGWAENLESFRQSGNPESLLPKYFGKYPEVRLGNELFIDAGTRSEVALLRQLQSAVVANARRHAEFSRLVEFGAGTGHNLLHLASDDKLESLRGFEWSWSGVACMNEIGCRLEPRISGRFFDYFAPDLAEATDLNGACAITVASLEQIGADFRPFLQFLRKAKPAVVCNIEPIQELMGSHELGALSVEYSKRRNYLDGYLLYLRNLEKAGVIRILIEQESLIGSKFINGYGVVIWCWRE